MDMYMYVYTCTYQQNGVVEGPGIQKQAGEVSSTRVLSIWQYPIHCQITSCTWLPSVAETVMDAHTHVPHKLLSLEAVPEVPGVIILEELIPSSTYHQFWHCQPIDVCYRYIHICINRETRNMVQWTHIFVAWESIGWKVPHTVYPL